MTWEVNNDGFWKQIDKTTSSKDEPMKSDWRAEIFFIGFILGILAVKLCG